MKDVVNCIIWDKISYGGSFICLNVCIVCVEVIGLWGSIDVLCVVYRVERGLKVLYYDVVIWRRDLDLGYVFMRGYIVFCFLREIVSCLVNIKIDDFIGVY